MCQIYPNLQVTPIWDATSMSSLLHFQTEGPGIESHQGRMLLSYFFLPHSLKNAQILMNVMFFMLIKTEISTCGTFSSIVVKCRTKKWRTTKGVTIYRYTAVSFCWFDIPVRLMRIPVYHYTIAVPCFTLVQLVSYRLSYVRNSLIQHAPDCAISSIQVFIFLG